MAVKEKIDVRDKIDAKLKLSERSLAWLSRQTGIAYSTLYNIFVHRIYELKQNQLDLINEAIEENFKL
jgi:lambda repressor-like predicted transcriptional regulator